MQDLKISLITVTLNVQETLSRCIDSVLAQTYTNIEYIIIDGGSTDNTLQIVNNYIQHIDFFISEPDDGIYQAMNKGIKYATGNIVGLLNADDYFTDNDVLSALAAAFTAHHTAVVYGNLDYVDLSGATIRKWRSGKYKHGLFAWGWMPPHPAFYCKRALFNQLGFYNAQYGTAADYELMLRFIHVNRVSVYYLNKTLVQMTVGGISNQSFVNRLKAWRFDIMAMSNNKILLPYISILLKPLRKIIQYVR